MATDKCDEKLDEIKNLKIEGTEDQGAIDEPIITYKIRFSNFAPDTQKTDILEFFTTNPSLPPIPQQSIESIILTGKGEGIVVFNKYRSYKISLKGSGEYFDNIQVSVKPYDNKELSPPPNYDMEAEEIEAQEMLQQSVNEIESQDQYIQDPSYVDTSQSPRKNMHQKQQQQFENFSYNRPYSSGRRSSGNYGSRYPSSNYRGARGRQRRAGGQQRRNRDDQKYQQNFYDKNSSEQNQYNRQTSRYSYSTGGGGHKYDNQDTQYNRNQYSYDSRRGQRTQHQSQSQPQSQSRSTYKRDNSITRKKTEIKIPLIKTDIAEVSASTRSIFGDALPREENLAKKALAEAEAEARESNLQSKESSSNKGNLSDKQKKSKQLKSGKVQILNRNIFTELEEN